MAKTTNSPLNNPEIDPELEHLKKKSAQGAMNVLSGFLDNPEIKEAIIRKLAMPLSAVFCLFIGVLGLCDVAKLVLGISWQVEAIISVVLLAIGLSYLLKNMLTGKRNDK